MKIKNLIIFLLIFFIVLVSACGKKGGNPVLNYLNNAQLKFDNKIERDNILKACNDGLKLSTSDLKEIKYKDDSGKEDQWSLQTLFNNHFIPDKPGLSWGNNFYEDLKQDSVQVILYKIIITY